MHGSRKNIHAYSVAFKEMHLFAFMWTLTTQHFLNVLITLKPYDILDNIPLHRLKGVNIKYTIGVVTQRKEDCAAAFNEIKKENNAIAFITIYE